MIVQGRLPTRQTPLCGAYTFSVLQPFGLSTTQFGRCLAPNRGCLRHSNHGAEALQISVNRAVVTTGELLKLFLCQAVGSTRKVLPKTLALNEHSRLAQRDMDMVASTLFCPSG